MSKAEVLAQGRDVLVKGRRGYIVVYKGNEALVSFGHPDIMMIPTKELTFIELVEKPGLIKYLKERRATLRRRDETEGVDEVDYILGEINSQKYQQPNERLARGILLLDLTSRMSEMQNDDNWDASLEDGMFMSEINSGRHDVLEAGAQKEVRECRLRHKCKSYEEHEKCMYIFNQQDCPEYEPETW